MTDKLEAIADGVRKTRNFDSPPLHLWDPPLSGDIDIRIDRDGQWFHEGDLIRRESIVRLFAAILRREDDGEYYLVTPGEKWRIKVDLLPLLVTDFEASAAKGLTLTLNTGKTVSLESSEDWYGEERAGGTAAIRLPHGLGALFSRPAWYRLVEAATTGEEGGSLRIAGLELD